MVRPKKATPTRARVVQTRVTDEEQAALQQAADHERRTLSDWIRIVLLDAAARVNQRAARKVGK